MMPRNLLSMAKIQRKLEEMDKYTHLCWFGSYDQKGPLYYDYYDTIQCFSFFFLGNPAKYTFKKICH